MSATPPQLSVDEDDSLDEIDSLTGKEKFKALQRRISNSTSVYSPAAVTTKSPSESPPATPPKAKRSHEKTASVNAKKLTHATKDRPRRKVRLPSRELLHRESKEHLDPPQIPPLPDNAAMMEYEDVLGLMPPVPPPPAADPAAPEIPSAPPPQPTSGKQCCSPSS